LDGAERQRVGADGELRAGDRFDERAVAGRDDDGRARMGLSGAVCLICLMASSEVPAEEQPELERRLPLRRKILDDVADTVLQQVEAEVSTNTAKTNLIAWNPGRIRVTSTPLPRIL
jgi:hypothetical protein